jgi:hypothetical protein
LFLISPLAQAQTLSPVVLASSGMSASTSTISMDYTIGEVAISTLSSSNNILTQGFHQGLSTTSGIDPMEGNTIPCTVFPNPVSDYLTIGFSDALQEDIMLCLTDITGKLLFQSVLTRGGASQSLTVPMVTYSPGMYFLRLQYKESASNSTIKIIKSNF